jgi:NADPH-dependent F420 reductase
VRIALIGGTGALGRALALGWAPRHEVLIGSREEARAEAAARRCSRLLEERGLKGDVGHGLNEAVARASDLLVLSVPHTVDEAFLRSLDAAIRPRAICISPVAPFSRNSCYLPLQGPSFAERLSRSMPRARVVSALQGFPAQRFISEGRVECDIPIASDDEEALDEVASLIAELPSLRPLRAGPLIASRLLEGLVPLLLNIMAYSGIRSPALKVV